MEGLLIDTLNEVLQDNEKRRSSVVARRAFLSKKKLSQSAALNLLPADRQARWRATFKKDADEIRKAGTSRPTFSNAYAAGMPGQKKSDFEQLIESSTKNFVARPEDTDYLKLVSLVEYALKKNPDIKLDANWKGG